MPAFAKLWCDAVWGRATLLVTLTMLMWAGNAIAGRAAVGEVSPFLLVFLRWAVVAGLLVAIAGDQMRAAWPELRLRLGYIVAMGVVGFTAFNAVFYVAAHYTVALNIGIIQGAMPVFVLIGAYFIFGTRITAQQVTGVLVTIAGVIVVAAAGDINRLLALVINSGDALMLLAASFYAAYTVYLREKPAVPGLAFMGALALVALVAAIPLVIYEAGTGTIQWPTATGWGIVAYVALFPSFLAQVFFIRGVELIGAGRAGVFINLVPVFAALLAVVLLGEQLQLFHLLALTLVLSGIWLAERGKARA